MVQNTNKYEKFSKFLLAISIDSMVHLKISFSSCFWSLMKLFFILFVRGFHTTTAICLFRFDRFYSAGEHCSQSFATLSPLDLDTHITHLAKALFAPTRFKENMTSSFCSYFLPWTYDDTITFSKFPKRSSKIIRLLFRLWKINWR